MARIEPDEKYRGRPCSYVGAGCAYEDVKQEAFNMALPDGLKSDGYLSLDNFNIVFYKKSPASVSGEMNC